MLRLTTLLLFAFPAFPQNAPSPQDAELARAAKNPYDIARFVDSHQGFDWNVLWKALGAEPLMIQPCGFLSSGTRQCSTELITVLNPDQVILLLKGDATPADIYLRFLQQKNGGWRFSGAFWDLIQQHKRRHEVDRSTGKPFLVVSADGIHGSGVDEEVECWFDLIQPEFQPALCFPLEGYQRRFAFEISRKIRGSMLAGSKNDEISGSLDVSFLAWDERGEEHYLGAASIVAVYTRAPEAKKLTFQRANYGFGRGPRVSKAEFEALMNLYEGPSNEDLMRYIMPRLREIASGRNDATKNWLKLFLSKAQNTPEVRELKALLK
jgi:hypothetical protein